ncbi:unnamed protein product, partial [Prorocentrum cordatum]
MVKHGKQGFSICVQCGNWAWNWRLKKQKGVCAVCNTPQPGWSTTTSGTWWAPWSSGGGWHDHGQSQPSLANFGDYLSKALAGAGLDGDPDAARLATEFSTLASQKLAAAPAPPPKPQHALLKEATADCSRKQEALEKAAKKLEQSRLQLEKDQAKFDEAADAVLAADLHRLEVQEAANPPEAATKLSGFALDPGLFECLDELEESDRQALEHFQKQLVEVTQLVDAKQKEFQDLLERTRTAHTAAAAKRRKRGADGEAVAGGGAEGTPAAGCAAAGPSKAKVVVQESDQKAMLERIKSCAQAQARAAADGKAAGAGKGGNAGAGKGVAAAGAGAGEKDMPDICQAIDKDGWRLAYTAARPSGKSEAGLSGGEWILGRQYDPDRRLGVKGWNHDVLVALGAFTRALADPWLVMADWNIEPAALRGTGWPQKLGAVVVTPSCRATCDKGPGRMYDYGLASVGCPEVSLRAELRVPWKTHCGVVVTVKAARAQRWYRHLAVPEPLPVRDRPVAVADPASKRSKKREEQRQRRMQALPIEYQEGFDELEPPAPPPAPTVSFAIPEETWFEAQTQVHWEGLPQLFEDQPEGARGKVAAFDRSQHFVFEWQPEERARLDESYGAWISTLERATLIHEQVDASTWMQFSGRARGPACYWAKVTSPPGRAHMKNEQAEWWGVVSTLLFRHAALRVNGADHAQAAYCAREVQARIGVLPADKTVEYFGKTSTVEEVELWKAMAADLDRVPVGQLTSLVGTTRKWADLSTSRALLASRSSFVKWVKESWSSKPGAVHRHVKQAPPLEWEGRDAAGAITTDRQTMLQTSASEWNAMWRDPVDQPADILYMMDQCLSAARDDPLPAIAIMDVDAVLPTLPAKKAKGVDVLNPIDIQRQPLVARQCLVDILNNIEQAGAWRSSLSSVL